MMSDILLGLENERMIGLEVPDITVELSPQELYERHPLPQGTIERIEDDRETVRRIFSGEDRRLLVIVGPCSLDDKTDENGRMGFYEYSRALAQLRNDPDIYSKLFIVERAPFAKPRTNVGPRGIEQIDLEHAHGIVHGLVTEEGSLPYSAEFMNRDHFADFGDMVTLAWGGARDMLSTHLRHTVSAYPEIPFLFKNDTKGDVKSILDAVKTAGSGHNNVDITLPDGRRGKMKTSPGNPTIGGVFRGGGDSSSAEFEASLGHFAKELGQHDVPLVVDCSHANSDAHTDIEQRTVEGQEKCFDHVLAMMKDGLPITGIMLESYIFAGKDTDKPGFSNTDPCISFERTEEYIRKLAEL